MIQTNVRIREMPNMISSQAVLRVLHYMLEHNLNRGDILEIT